MPKHSFFVPDQPPGGALPLPADEASHATRVLRLEVGDEVFIVDGKGRRSIATLETVTKRGVVARVLESETERPGLNRRVTVAAALIKNAGRYETMLEKAAEIGAVRVIPLRTRRTEQSRLREDRARKILVGAMKQSGSAYLTELAPVTKWASLLKDPHDGTLRLLCHESADQSATIASAMEGHDGDVLVAVGPEGGFSDEEVEEAIAAGFRVVSLGRPRLRAETATIVALAAISQLD